MTEILSVIDEAHVEREAKVLEGFYASVRRRAAGITSHGSFGAEVRGRD